MKACDYGWIITKDLISEECGDKPEVGVNGPRNISDATLKRLKAGEGVKFRLYDDDGNLYYEGLQIEGDEGDEGTFAPLDNFGAPNSGCTELKQFLKNEWVSI
jgi:hypothetical protein